MTQSPLGLSQAISAGYQRSVQVVTVYQWFPFQALTVVFVALMSIILHDEGQQLHHLYHACGLTMLASGQLTRSKDGVVKEKQMAALKILSSSLMFPILASCAWSYSSHRQFRFACQHWHINFEGEQERQCFHYYRANQDQDLIMILLQREQEGGKCHSLQHGVLARNSSCLVRLVQVRYIFGQLWYGYKYRSMFSALNRAPMQLSKSLCPKILVDSTELRVVTDSTLVLHLT